MYTSAPSNLEPASVLHKPSYDQIAGMAYWLYVEQGCCDGHGLDDWLRAEQLLTMQLNELAAPFAPVLQTADEPQTNGVWTVDAAADSADTAEGMDQVEYPRTLEERATSDLREFRPRRTNYRPISRQSRFDRPVSNGHADHRANASPSLELLSDSD